MDKEILPESFDSLAHKDIIAFLWRERKCVLFAAFRFHNLIYPHLPHFVPSSAQCNVLEPDPSCLSEVAVTDILVLLSMTVLT